MIRFMLILLATVAIAGVAEARNLDYTKDYEVVDTPDPRLTLDILRRGSKVQVVVGPSCGPYRVTDIFRTNGPRFAYRDRLLTIRGRFRDGRDDVIGVAKVKRHGCRTHEFGFRVDRFRTGEGSPGGNN